MQQTVHSNGQKLSSFVEHSAAAEKDQTTVTASELMNSIRHEKAFRSVSVDSTASFSAQERDPSEFLKRHGCKEEPTIKAVFKELDANYPDGVTDEVVLQQFEELGDLGFIFNISKDTLTYVTKPGSWSDTLDARAQQYQSMLQELLDEVRLPHMKFVLSLMDGAPGGQWVFRNEGFLGRELMILPRALLDWGADVADMVETTETVPCETISRKGVFRGATTGSGTEGWIWDGSRPLPLRDPSGWVPPRYVAAELAKDHPDILDAGFTSVVGAGEHSEDLQEKMADANLIKDELDDDQQRCYAAVVVIDGNAQADRLPRQMAYGTATIVVHNSTRRWPDMYSKLTHTKYLPNIGNDEFWYGEPENGKHWLIVDVEHLEYTLRRVLANEKLRTELGRNSLAYVKERLTESRLKCYMYTLMSEYAKRYKKNKPK